MGGARFCSQCRTSHEGTTGKKCQLIHQGEMGTSGANNVDSQQASISLFSDCNVNEDQARSTAEQVVSPSRVPVNVEITQSPQNLILQELKKMSDRFGKLEEQAAEDRQVLSGLVVGFNKQGQTMDKILSTSNVTQEERHSSSQNRSVSISQSSDSIQGNVTIERNSNSGPGHSNVQVNTHYTTSPTCVLSSHIANPTTTTLSYTPIHQHIVNRTVTRGNTSTESQAMSASINGSDIQQTSQARAFWDQMHTHMSNKATSHAASHIAHNITQPSHLSSVFSATSMAGQHGAGVLQQNGVTGTVRARGRSQETVAHLGTREEPLIPSIQALKNSADIHSRVNQRYAELEEAGTIGQQGNFNSFLESLHKHVSKQEKIKVKWPQDLAFIGTQRKRPTYDQLNSMQWLLGFLRIRQEEQDPVIREHMIDYLTELTQDACDFSWEAAKGAHAVLMHRMGDGVITWSDIAEIHKLRTRYAQTHSIQGVSDKAKNLKVVPCLQFNKGSCNKLGDHEWKNLLLRHMCQFCHNTHNKVESHARKDCWKAGKDMSKN